MAAFEPKKLALIRIWQILLKHSDYDHRLTHEDIIKHLYNDYGIEMERKAISKVSIRDNISSRADALNMLRLSRLKSAFAICLRFRQVIITSPRKLLPVLYHG